jgi:hypothetical protein
MAASDTDVNRGGMHDAVLAAHVVEWPTEPALVAVAAQGARMRMTRRSDKKKVNFL